MIDKIERFAKKFYLNRLLQGVLVGAALWIVFFLLLNALEYFSWFSSKVRFALLLLLIAVSACVFVYYFAIPLINLIRFRKKMSIERAALLIGAFFPDIQDKLLNTIQLSNGVDSQETNELLAAAIEQRTAQLSPIRFSDAVDLKGNLRYLWVFLGLLLLLVVLVLFLPRFAVQPTQRILNYEQHFEKPLPFTVTLSDESIETRQGSDVPYSIHVEGSHIPDAFYVKSSLGQQLFSKTSVNDFEVVFKNVYHSLSFQIVGGDYVSQPIAITVHPNPVLLSYQCKVSYPAYIHRAAEVFDGKARLLVPQGSVLDLSFSMRDADSAFVTIDSLLVPLSVVDGVATYRFTAANSKAIDFVCSNNWSSEFDPLRFTVDVLPDAYPDIRVESFDEELSTQVYYTGLITDDYGFTKLTFNCLIKQPVERQIVLPVVFDRSQTRTSFFYHFNMDSLGVMPGQTLEVHFTVWDNDGFHGPKSKRSETFTYYKPSKSALDSIADQAEEALMEKMAERSSEASKIREDLEKMLQELASKKELDWSDKEKIKELLDKQQQLEEDWNRMQEEQQQLSDFMKQHDLASEELMKKQEKINELFEELIPDELKKMMEEIEKLLDEMPRDKMQQMLQDMKKDNNKLQDLLDRNLSLLEQLRMEKDLNELMDQLNKLGEELEKQTEEASSAEEAKEQFDAMMQELDSLLEKNKTLSDPFAIQKDEALQESIDKDLQDAADAESQDTSGAENQDASGAENQEDDSESDSEMDGDSSDGQSPDGNQSPKQKAAQQKQSAGQKMKQMASSLMMQMMSSSDDQLAEDAHLVRILLENVVRSSHQQESLMRSIGRMRNDDPSISEKIVRQKDLSGNFLMVKDSLKAMALRQPMIQNFIFDELDVIDKQTDVALKYMNDLHLSLAVANQQIALESMNNLALMLSESLQDMEMSMMGSGSSSGKSKPKPGQQGKSMQQMKDLQQQLGEQLKQLQEKMNQPGGQQSDQLSEEFARMAAEQQMLRQGMQQMLDEMKKDGQLGDDGLNQIMKDMEKLEEDLVNKRITKKTIERNQEILSRMLESEKAQQKRDQDEKRKSNEYKGSKFDRQVDEQLYQQRLKKQQEFLQQNPIQYQPYYKTKINEYYIKKNLLK
ncbi:MAG: hypothetical protein IKT08_08695 [Bacteroidales bacterium]|nr:hypothetical protein [Bacteroidales bacterium]